MASTVFTTLSSCSRTAGLRNSITPKISLRILMGNAKVACTRSTSGSESCSVLASFTISEIQRGSSLCQTRPGTPIPRGSAGRSLQWAKSFAGSCQVFRHSIIWLVLSTSQNVPASQSSPMPMISRILPHATSAVSDSASASVTWCSTVRRWADCLRWLMSRLHSRISRPPAWSSIHLNRLSTSMRRPCLVLCFSSPLHSPVSINAVSNSSHPHGNSVASSSWLKAPIASFCE